MKNQETQPATSPLAKIESENQPFRFSLVDLLIWTGLIGALFGVSTAQGLQTGRVFVPILVLLTGLSILGMIVDNRTTKAARLVGSIILTLLCFVLGYAVIGLLSLSFLVGALFLIWLAKLEGLQLKYQGIAWLALLLANIMLLVFFQHVALRHIYDARKEFPKVDLNDRLEFKSRPVSGLSFVDAATVGELDYPILNRRKWALSKIHDKTNAAFVAAPNAGVMRMPLLKRVFFDPIELKSIPLETDEPLQPWKVGQEFYDRFEEWRYTYSPINPWEYFPKPKDVVERKTQFHLASIFDFVQPSTLGYVNENRVAVGFVEHAFFHRPPSLRIPSPSGGSELYRLDKLQLVGLLNFETPQVYLSDNLPNMSELVGADFPHRDLDEFEKQALENLTQGDDLYVREDTDGIRMLGAIRSVDACLACHDGGVNDMLGAFSYKLVKVGR